MGSGGGMGSGGENIWVVGEEYMGSGGENIWVWVGERIYG